MNTGSQRPMSAAMAVAIGHLMITFPMLVISCMVVTLLVLMTQNWRFGIVGLIVGIVIAGAWWALVTPFWRRWALGRGVPPDQLQKWAMMTGLVLPGGKPVVPSAYTSAPDPQRSQPEDHDEIHESPEE